MKSEQGQISKERPRADTRGLLNHACSRFEDLTGERLRSRSLNDLEKIILDHQQEGKTILSSTARNNCLQIVEIVKGLAGPIGEATALVFSPASACFSALSFLLEIPSKIHAIHESINAVFDEVEPQFIQLKVYDRMENPDQDLLIYACNVMMAFVDLCAQCVKQNKKGRLSKLYKEGKWVLLNENPIKAGLDQLQKLSERKEGLQSTIILEKILHSEHILDGIDTKVDGIRDYVGRRSDEQTRQDELIIIRNRFGMSDDRVLMSHRVFAENAQLATVRSSWFLEWEAYRKWTCRENQDVRPLLLVTGAQGTGKSVSAASMFLDLKSSLKDDEQALIAYYTFPPVPKNCKDNQQPLESGVKSIGLQLAEQSPVYRRRLLRALRESTTKDTDYKRLWKTLNVWKPADKTTSYLFLDGLDNLSDSEFNNLMDELTASSDQASPEASYFRIFVTGRRNLLQKYSRSKLCLDTVEIERFNRQEIEGYIEWFLKTKDLLQENYLDFGELRKSILAGLLRKSYGSFQRTQKRLDKVESLVRSDSRDELSHFLETLDRGESGPSESELRDLERILDAKEIEELNELIIWAEFGSRYFGVEQLEAFLFIRSSSPPLRSLRKKIQDRFSLILEERDDGVRLREDMKQWVIMEQSGRLPPAVTATISVTNAEIEVAQRFFWDLAHHSVMNRFNFDAHQVDMSKPSTQRIQVTPLNAHLVMVKRTFEFLRRAPHALSQPIGGVLLASLPGHLSDLRRLPAFEQIADADRRTIGENVQELFFNPMNLERHWDTFQDIAWHTNEDSRNSFWEWLKDDAAIKHLGVRGKLEEVNRDPKRNQKLFESLAKLAGRRWLQDRTSSAMAAFEWLRNFLELDAEDENSKDSSEDGSGEDDRVSKVEEWCKEALGVRHLRGNDIWLQRVAETYQSVGENKKAFEKYQETNEILEEMGDLDRDRRVGVLICLASLADDEDDALKYKGEAFRLDPRNIDARYELFKSRHARGDEAEVASLVTEALELKSSTRPISHLGLMVEMAIEDDESDTFELLNTISSICSSSLQSLDRLLEDMETAIDNAKEQKQHEFWATLLLHKGIALSCYSDDYSRFDKAVQAWNECSKLILENIKQQSAGAILLDQVGRQLSSYYFEQTIKDPANAAEHAEKLKQIFEEQKGIVHGMSAAKTYLAAYRVLSGDQSAARSLFKEDIVEAFALLSDNTTRNDHRGYTLLFQILLYTGDHINSLVAFSLLARRVLEVEILKEWLLPDGGEAMSPEASELVEFFKAEIPECYSPWEKVWFMSHHLKTLAQDQDHDGERKPFYEKLVNSMSQYDEALDDANNDYVCDRCGGLLESEAPMYACQYCYNIGLCEPCLQQLKDGTFKTPLCRASHQWMQIPPWNPKTHVRAYRRKVCMDAVIGENGSLTGGEEVSVVEWLERLKEDWKPEGVWTFH
ncbi:hypothetical protein ASPZODRAFT_139374 [Penicilliopsis zonata CBS 506.65]|uniref:Uncharacterized protein n=1 Tax=Penicilliopsis zonata CBS 506.65 TaxID=1073090 RepID=A0A1L9SS86_9EURO|nr:hypothetical protein ASPZODRAFT_139374 [Penicilliopsis zonata CBS 506.65]OJJ50039.1 hypothetical protein ASPZODRAFT_139374 [Penicilliopsis zonata CBS 506.65]